MGFCKVLKIKKMSMNMIMICGPRPHTNLFSVPVTMPAAELYCSRLNVAFDYKNVPSLKALHNSEPKQH